MRTAVVFGVLAMALAVVVADELKDLSSVDVPVAPATTTDKAPAPHENKADLGEGAGGWGGSLMTSGSFTMMASQGAEEEEELGEGAGGWGGSLMTSGSFTMMASQGA